MRRVPLWVVNTLAWLALVGGTTAAVVLVQWLFHGGLSGP